MFPHQRIAILGKSVPGARHFQELIALGSLRHLLGEGAAFFCMLTVFGCLFHISSPYGSVYL